MTYTLFSFLLVVVFLLGIRLMNSPRTAVAGNLVGSLAMFVAVITILMSRGLLSTGVLWLSLAIGAGLGYWLAVHAAVIRMPQFVALLNGLGGGASFLTSLAFLGGGGTLPPVDRMTAGLAVFVGGVTFSGSMVAAAKLDGRIAQRPVRLKWHSTAVFTVLALSAAAAAGLLFYGEKAALYGSFLLAAALLYGIVFAIRIGGADMPITISLLNSLSGVAASIAGFAVGNTVLVAVGAIVGAAGLILTRIMCRAMNRTLFDIIAGRTTIATGTEGTTAETAAQVDSSPEEKEKPAVSDTVSDIDALKEAASVVIVPGYGMALAQAQYEVKRLYDNLVMMGKDVGFAIHPVAGRMPGHMNVLLAEVDIPYDRLIEMDVVNPAFSTTDAVVIVGANDVVNPAAATTTGTPISGMPILKVTEARRVIVCNLDTKPGYAGVENPLYTMEKVSLRIGDAKESVAVLADALKTDVTG